LKTNARPPIQTTTTGKNNHKPTRSLRQRTIRKCVEGGLIVEEREATTVGNRAAVTEHPHQNQLKSPIWTTQTTPTNTGKTKNEPNQSNSAETCFEALTQPAKESTRPTNPNREPDRTITIRDQQHAKTTRRRSYNSSLLLSSNIEQISEKVHIENGRRKGGENGGAEDRNPSSHHHNRGLHR